MSVTVGRLRPCPILDFKFVALSHNTCAAQPGDLCWRLNGRLKTGRAVNRQASVARFESEA